MTRHDPRTRTAPSPQVLAAEAAEKVAGARGRAEAALAAGDAAQALYEARDALFGELRKLWRWRPGDADLAATRMAATLLFNAAQMHDYVPARPAGCTGDPQPADLLEVFAGRMQSLQHPRGGASS